MSTETETKKITKCKCENCGYEWRPMKDVLPKVCPKCKSFHWNKSEEKKA